MYVCAICGSPKVQVKAWVDANTNEFCSDCETGKGWCNYCYSHVHIENIPDEEFESKEYKKTHKSE